MCEARDTPPFDRRREEQLFTQSSECFCIVNIVPGRQHFNWQIDFCCALSGVSEHVRGAPGNFIKKIPVRVLQANQIVATVFRGSQHYPITVGRKRLDRANQDRSR